MVTMFTMVTRCTGGLSQLPVVEMSWGKKSKKKTSLPTNFHVLVNFIRHTGPMVTMVTRCTGNLSQLPGVKMNWGKKYKKKPNDIDQKMKVGPALIPPTDIPPV